MPVESGGSEVNPSHEPFHSRGGITAEMQVSSNWNVAIPASRDWLVVQPENAA